MLPLGSTIADAGEAALLLAKQRTTYHVTVYTGDLFGAGTDADVFLQMFGESQDSGKAYLNILYGVFQRVLKISLRFHARCLGSRQAPVSRKDS